MAKDFIAFARRQMGPKSVARAEKRHQQLRREMLLREIRRAMHIPQEQLSRKTGISQPNLSRLEKQSDMQIATLRKVVSALGGELEVIARFKEADVRIILPAA